MKKYMILLLGLIAFYSCNSDDDGDERYWEPEYVGSVTMKIDGRPHSLKVHVAKVSYEVNDPEQGLVVVVATSCEQRLIISLYMLHELGENDIMAGRCAIQYDHYSSIICGWDKDKLDAPTGPTEYFKSGTVNISEMGNIYKGTFSGVTEGFNTSHVISEGRFEFTISSRFQD